MIHADGDMGNFYANSGDLAFQESCARDDFVSLVFEPFKAWIHTTQTDQNEIVGFVHYLNGLRFLSWEAA